MKTEKELMAYTVGKEFNINDILNLHCQFRNYHKDGDFVFPEQYDRIISAMRHWYNQQFSSHLTRIKELEKEVERLKKYEPIKQCGRTQNPHSRKGDPGGGSMGGEGSESQYPYE